MKRKKICIMLAVLCLAVCSGCNNQNGKASDETGVESGIGESESVDLGTEIAPSASETQNSSQTDQGNGENAGIFIWSLYAGVPGLFQGLRNGLWLTDFIAGRRKSDP